MVRPKKTISSPVSIRFLNELTWFYINYHKDDSPQTWLLQIYEDLSFLYIEKCIEKSKQLNI